MRKYIQQKLIPANDLQDTFELVKRRIANLHRENGRLRKLALEIKELIDSMKKRESEVERIEYFKNQFIYTGKESQNQSFFHLKHGTKNDMEQTFALIQLQVKIQQFIAEFLQIPQTNYVLYYRDDQEVRRMEIPPGASLEKLQRIYANSGRRLLHLDADTKRLIAEKRQSIVVTQHFDKYVAATQDWAQRKRIKAKSYNMGHIAEAFERHWQNLTHSTSAPLNADWTTKEIALNFWASKGNVAWWRSGDVKNKQVKWLGDNASVKTGSFTSIEELANYIVWLSQQSPANEAELEELTRSIAKAFTDPAAIEEYADGTLARMLASIIES